ncbi:phage portal protein [Delftia sp. PS-11]|uniref:phage portal protein n=1 Tax=Delftia sp. PS-11 TaxID=2767222 RepID=UPI002453AA0E|nr:phage portal protein [Delftia sp. PS-11]KAJ8743684.1 phage portal protein [Delftia sp. PS-11]
MRADLKALADAVIQAVRAKMAPLAKRLDEMDGAIKALPESLTQDLGERVKAAVDAIPRPKDGEDGKSVTAEDVAPIIASEVAKAVQAIPVPKDGESVTIEQISPVVAQQVAKAVADLPKPKDGESVPVDEVQRMVDEAVAKAMQAIPVPKDGQAGRDALQLELLPCIDMEKSYPRGTYARHAGGLWRAFETTKGLHGWECVVDGIADLRIEQDGRQFTLVARTSSGEEVSKSVKVAALVDRGVFKMDEPYEAGDGVTWGGSFFIAQKDAPTGRPGEPGCDGWRLAVKRGRDGSKGVSV